MEVLHNVDLTPLELNIFMWILNVMQVSVTDDRQIISVISHNAQSKQWLKSIVHMYSGWITVFL